ncbi:MAG: VWA domain-containing protein [Deltaproteobacteria bacterium]|nr:VWA domain-containing protein [Deltaproteobacteria bacterium]MCB9786802.1 VWA domain-containing protein [Deltaproteobacteria bacterium]
MNALQWGDLDAAIWALVVLGLLFGFIGLWFWRRSRLEALAAQGPLAGLLDARGGGRFWLRATLVLLSAALLVVALMRPQHGSRETSVKNLGIDIAIVLDASKSMKVADIVPDRLGASRLEIHQLLDRLTGGRVALVPFAGLAFTQTELTSDFQVVETYLSELRVEDMPRGGTAIGRALVEGIRALVPPERLEGTMAEASHDQEAAAPVDAPTPDGSKHKAIILFTDGDDHEGNPKEAAELAKKLGIHVYTVGVGTAQGRPVPIINDSGQTIGTVKGPDGKTPLFSELNEGLLRELAQGTGGEYFHLGPTGLGDGLWKQIDALEKAEYDATFQHLRDDRFQLALAPAVLLLLLEALLAGRRRRGRKDR